MLSKNSQVTRVFTLLFINIVTYVLVCIAQITAVIIYATILIQVQVVLVSNYYYIFYVTRFYFKAIYLQTLHESSPVDELQ